MCRSLNLNLNLETENMTKRLLCLLLATALLPTPGLAAPIYKGRESVIRFSSHTALEDIRAESTAANSVWDAKTGMLQFTVKILSFNFPNALMEEHFNENYMESEKFPNALFKGTLSGMTVDQAATPGTYPVTFAGDFQVHGVTRPLKATAKATVDAAGVVTAESDFKVKLADFGIKVPDAVGQKIAEVIEVHVEVKLELYKK